MFKKLSSRLSLISLFCFFGFVSVSSTALSSDITTYTKIGDYTVHYSVFNSTFVTPKVAQTMGLTRAKNQKLLNVAVVKGNELHGSPAVIKGQTKDLMSVTKTLKFKEIREGQATYYLAPIRSDSEEVIHFHLQVRPDPNSKTHEISFTRKLYKDK